ncbi:LysE family translocator [Bacillus massiliigorillae]|uniref:LysE family translocator n=1 Tax=Bacillus massiliigorillae TaxID=1243664 RepID=UPI0005AA11AA|nr:LysE family translocator [Bacillus massiliigorillae]
MFTLSTLSAFVIIVLGLFIIPGPAVLLVATRTAQSGRKAGIMAGLGVATGDLIHTLFTAVGLSAILMTSSVAFNFIKFAGAAYLLYLGIRAILEKPANPQISKVTPVSSIKAYTQAILVEVLNPKTSLFFLAFLPQFIHPGNGPSFLQFLILGLIFVLLSAIYTTFLALSVQMLGRLIKRVAWIGRWSGKIVGTIYIGLGLKVAIQSQ